MGDYSRPATSLRLLDLTDRAGVFRYWRDDDKKENRRGRSNVQIRRH